MVIIDYDMGNVGSIRNMLKHVGHEAVVSKDPTVIAAADKLILPGVGAFDTGMAALADLRPLLQERVVEASVPVLGICLGMQLLMESSEEGSHAGLGWIEGRATRFRALAGESLRVPHMGWNATRTAKPSPLLFEMPADPRFYFVHSYRVQCTREEDVLLWADYGGSFAAAVSRENVHGVQFHPEKSHRFGMRILKNFAERG